jgi:hypothetical protein
VAVVSIATVDVGRGRLVPVPIVVEVTVVSVAAFVIVAVVPVAAVVGAVVVITKGIAARLDVEVTVDWGAAVVIGRREAWLNIKVAVDSAVVVIYR